MQQRVRNGRPMSENGSRRTESRERKPELGEQRLLNLDFGMRNAELLDCGMEFGATRIQDQLLSVSFERLSLCPLHYALC
jgi:hypothetical protein